METTRSVLSASREGRSPRNDTTGFLAKFGQALQQPSDEDANKTADGQVLPPTTLTAVISSLNKMNFLRQRTLANKGNVTPSCPIRKFEPSEVQREMDQLLERALKSFVYTPVRAANMSKRLSESIRDAVKNMKFPRYKVVAMVTITDRGNQCMLSGSRCLWNTACDSSATTQYKTDKIMAVATVFAMMKE